MKLYLFISCFENSNISKGQNADGEWKVRVILKDMMRNLSRWLLAKNTLFSHDILVVMGDTVYKSCVS